MVCKPDSPGEALGILALAALVSLVGAGAALALAGALVPVALFPAWIALTALLAWIGRSRHATRWRPSRPHPAVLVVAAIVIAVTAVNLSSAAAHILTERDPGVYTVSGRWLARSGSIEVTGIAETPFGREPGVTAQSAAAFIQGDGPPGSLTLVRPAGWPALLAAAQLAGGDAAMFMVPPLLAALALCFFAGLAWRIAGPWFGAAAVTALAVNLAQAYVSRDAFAECATQALALGALWGLLVALRDRHRGRAFVAGLAIGAGVAIHFPAILVLTGLLLSAAIEEWLDDGSAAYRRSCYAVTCGTAGVTSLVGLVALFHWTGPYARAHESMIRTLAVMTAIAALVYVATFAARRLRRLGPPGAAFRRVVGLVAAGGVGAAACYAWFVRPHVERTRVPDIAEAPMAGMQQAAGAALEPTRAYSELTMQWLASYMGPVALALGLAGLVVACSVGLRRDVPVVRLLLPLGVVVTAVYCYRPSAFPDQLWVMRRFTAEVIPILLLFGCWLLAQLWGVRTRARRTAQGAIVAAAALLVVLPLAVLLPVARGETGRRYEDGIHLLCQQLGSDSAVLVVGEPAAQTWYPHTVQAFCGVPVGTLAGRDPDAIRRLATAWGERGRRLVLLSRTNRDLAAQGVAGANARLITVPADREIALTFNRPPTDYLRTDLLFATVEVPADRDEQAP